MRHAIFFTAFAALLFGAPPINPAEGPVPPGRSLPDTPAGRSLSGYLDALNSGDRDRIRAYLQERFMPFWFEGRSVEALAEAFLSRARGAGGRLTPRKILHDEPYIVSALVEQANGGWSAVQVQVEAEPPHRVTALRIEAAGPPAPTGRARDDADLGASLRRFIDGLTAADQFSGAVLVRHGTTTVLRAAWGQADRSLRVANTPETGFQLASLNKMFTAVAVAQLAEAGKLSFSDTVGRALPEYPNTAVRERVTIEQLLTHTSGIGGDPLTSRWERSSKTLFRTIDDYLPEFALEPLSFEPGSRFAYSNAGFELLGRIIEKISGARYDDVLARGVFGPAGMSATRDYDADTITPALATGYTHTRLGDRESAFPSEAEGWFPNTFLKPVRGGPAGGGYATVDDLARFADALFSGRLVDRSLLQRLVTGRAEVQKTATGSIRYGDGFFDWRLEGEHYVGHAGRFWGASALLHVFPERGYTLVVLSNVDGGAEPVARRFRELLPDPAPAAPMQNRP